MMRVVRRDLLYDGCYLHIISRSMRGRKMFKDEEDFLIFKRLILVTKKKYDIRIYHYCLMGTHFHLAVQANCIESLSHAMRDIKGQYTKNYHEKYRISGPLWRDRYRSLLIEDENYLFVCGQYIENNPVRAGLVEVSYKWPFSSARHYEGLCRDELIDDYDEGVCPRFPEDADVENDKFFERGKVIGSSFFRFQMRDLVDKE